MGCKEVVVQCARKTLQRHLMNHLMQPLQCLIELIRGLIELSDDGFWGCGVLSELKVGLRMCATVGKSSRDAYTHTCIGRSPMNKKSAALVSPFFSRGKDFVCAKLGSDSPSPKRTHNTKTNHLLAKYWTLNSEYHKGFYDCSP